MTDCCRSAKGGRRARTLLSLAGGVIGYSKLLAFRVDPWPWSSTGVAVCFASLNGLRDDAFELGALSAWSKLEWYAGPPRGMRAELFFDLILLFHYPKLC